MTTSKREDTPFAAIGGMTPERWQVVDTILQAALACERDARAAFIADACGADDSLRREVESLLAAHDGMSEEFLEQPAIAVLGGMAAPLSERLAAALGDRYAIEGEIARGGMATVFLARDVRHGRRVAIKVMREEIAAAVGGERFLEEIRVTALLQHPHVLPLFDSGSASGLLWYVMPFVEGETLRARLAREGRLPIDEAVRIAREMADALEHAHARGIVHRDVKPENVLLQGGHALVSDFGIALALEQAGGERLTRTGLTLGTPQYMSPEQAAGERALDARVDVYALGAVLYEMIAGEPPFAAPSRQLVLQRLLLEPPRPPSAGRPEVPAAIDIALQRALAKRPSDRFPSASAFAAALVPTSTATPEATRRSAQSFGTAGVTDSGARPKGMVSIRLALLGVIAGIAAGLLGGWGLAHSWQAGPWMPISSPGQPSLSTDANAALAPIDRGASDGATDGLSLVILDRSGALQRRIAANRPWTPRFSPDGRRVAYGAFGVGRTTSDVWVTDLDAGTTRRITDDDGDSNDPQWSPDGRTIAYSVNAPGGKDLASRGLADGAARVVAARNGTQFPSDWVRDGKALLVTDDRAAGGHDIIVQPTDGSPARSYAATTADETTARASPDGRWIAYTSDASGKQEVYLDSYPTPGHRVQVSQGGGSEPVWRGDGRELYYWRGDTLVAVQLGAAGRDAPPPLGTQTVLFRIPFQSGINTMYDASPDGQRFVIVARP